MPLSLAIVRFTIENVVSFGGNTLGRNAYMYSFLTSMFVGWGIALVVMFICYVSLAKPRVQDERLEEDAAREDTVRAKKQRVTRFNFCVVICVFSWFFTALVITATNSIGSGSFPFEFMLFYYNLGLGLLVFVPMFSCAWWVLRAPNSWLRIDAST